METEKYTVLRVRKTTRDLLKLVSVLSHASMVETIDRLARQELARIQEKPDAALQKRAESRFMK